MLTAGELIRWSANTFLALATIGSFYILIAGLLMIRYRAVLPQRPATPVPVTVLVPLCGYEPGLDFRLRALCEQEYAAPVQIVCGVRNSDDPAIDVVRRIAAERPDRTIELKIDPLVHGRNLKVSNLINMVPRARHDTFVLIDSDIEVDPTYLSRVVGILQQPGVGAVTCLYHGLAVGGIWARLAAMGINMHFLPNVIVALASGLGRPCFGSTIAMSRDIWGQIGGFRAFADYLWDDYAIGEAVRALGYRVAVTDFSLGHVCSDASARQLLAGQLRYARTIRSIDPIGHAGGIIWHPFALALLALLCGGGGQAVTLMAVALTCRYVVCWQAERRFGAPTTDYWLVPMRELLSFVVYVASFFGATVKWRGNRYRVTDQALVTDPQ